MGVRPISVPPGLARVLDTAGSRSDVDFGYLLHTAIRESSLNPKAKAATSSATGLFQFLDATWLQVMKSEGPRLGYGRYADAIVETPGGELTIRDKALREEILKLREDPQVAADLAAAFTRSNGARLLERFGRMPSPGELYIAHFLGAEGAAQLFEAGLADPDRIAADLFPRQAKANRAIFFEDGRPRTIRQVYQVLVAQHEGSGAPSSGFAAQQIAADPAPKWPAQQALPSRFSPDEMSFTSLFSTEAETAPRALLTPADDAAASAFFTQLYAK